MTKVTNFYFATVLLFLMGSLNGPEVQAAPVDISLSTGNLVFKKGSDTMTVTVFAGEDILKSSDIALGNAEALREYGVFSIKPNTDGKSLLLEIRALGKHSEGKPIQLTVVDSREGMGDSEPLSVTFGDSFKAVPCPTGTSIPNDFVAGVAVDICVENENKTKLPAGAATIGTGNLNFEIVKNDEGCLNVKTLDSGSSTLVVSVDDFSYTLLSDKKSVEEIEEILLKNVKTETVTTIENKPASTVEIRVNGPETKVFVVAGRTRTGKIETIDWVVPHLKPFDCTVSEKGRFTVQGSTAGKATCVVKLPLAPKPDHSTVFASTQSLRDLTVEVLFDSVTEYLDLSVTDTSPVLTPGSKVRVRGIVRKALGNEPDQGAGRIDYETVDARENIWFNVSSDGANATVTLRNPSAAEIEKAYDGQNRTRPTFVLLKGKAKTSNGNDVFAEIQLSVGFVKKFDQLKVKLDVMDDRSATDLYGPTTAKEYYVLNVRLNNNLRDETGQPTGNSIIAYGASLEVAVGLEKRWNSDRKADEANVLSAKEYETAIAALKKTVVSADVKPEGYDRDRATLDNELQRALTSHNNLLTTYNQRRTAWNNAISRHDYDDKVYEAAVGAQKALQQADALVVDIRNRITRLEERRWRHYWSQRSVNLPDVDSSNRAISINDGKWHDVTRTDFRRLSPSLGYENPAEGLNDPSSRIPSPTELRRVEGERSSLAGMSGDIPPCVGTITYRPLTFEMTVNTVDRRDARSKRSIFFRVLEGVGSAASFLTAIAVPAAGSDLPLGLEKYTNLLMPAMNRSIPDLKEQYRQNIVAQTMKPIEEIPYGADLTRVIFLPKTRIQGLIVGHDVRISQVCPFYFNIEVAEIQSGGTVTRGVSIP